MLLLVSLMLPILISCDKSDDKKDDTTVADTKDESGDTATTVDENVPVAAKETEPKPEPTPEPGADVPAGGLLKKYDFADGLQGIVTYDGGQTSPNDDDKIEIIEIGGQKVLALGHKFNGWDLAMFSFPQADIPLISKVSKVKCDVYMPVEDADAITWDFFAAARTTDWGKWWEGWDWTTEQIKAAATVVEGYYKFSYEFDYTIEVNGEGIPLSEGFDTFEMSLGAVVNGYTSISGLPICFGNIEFIK